MLKRRSIRTKLIVALALLSTTVVLLASSGFWGLYRYKPLVAAVSQRAMEIPFANALNRSAMTMQDSNDRMNRQRNNQEMIAALPFEDGFIDEDAFIDVVQDERNRFEEALLGFSIQLQLYEDKLGMTSVEPTMLVDEKRQRREVGEMHATFEALNSFYREPAPMDESRQAQLDKHLRCLVKQSEEHLSLIHSGMAKFSTDVRGQYRIWVAVAWSSTVLALFMVGALLWVFRSLVVKPFTTLLAGSRLVVEGQFDHRIDLGTSDELSELAEAMNGMTDRFQSTLAQLDSVNRHLDQQVQQRTREVIQNEQLASVGFLAAGVAHEINNPLATIAWSAESLASRVSESRGKPLRERIEDEDLCDALRINLQRIEDEAFRCKGITEKLLDFSRLSEVQRAPTDLVELVNDVITMVTKVGKYKCKTIRIHGCKTLVADVNPQEIRQVVLNLVTNALESVDTDGAVDVTIGKTTSMATVVVKDNGCGMSTEVLQHLFEPFFTRRRDGTGTGLGLSITYRIVSQHGGSLIANSDGDGCGSQIEIQLPLKQQDKDSVETTNQQGRRDDRYETSKE